MGRKALTMAAFVGGVAAAAVVGVVPAWAHVTINPSQAVQGGYATLAFRVPTEKDNASTVKLEVNIPTDAPIASVSIRPVAGWTAKTETSKLATPVKTDNGETTEAISKITWTASSAAVGIGPGQFQDFEASAGPLPQVDQIVFKTLQTYSDGEVVRWIEETPAGGAEPQNPAPVLRLAKAAATDSGHHGTSTTQTAVVTADAHSDSGGNRAGVGLAAAALVIAVGGLAVALLSWRRAGRTPN